MHHKKLVEFFSFHLENFRDAPKIYSLRSMAENLAQQDKSEVDRVQAQGSNAIAALGQARLLTKQGVRSNFVTSGGAVRLRK
jgi:hypothetical protein